MKISSGLGFFQWVALSPRLILCACSDGKTGSVTNKRSVSDAGSATNTSSAPAVSEETKQAVADYKTRWDKKVKATQEVVAVLEQHFGAGKTAAPVRSIEPTDKAKFVQQKRQGDFLMIFTVNGPKKSDIVIVLRRYT